MKRKRLLIIILIFCAILSLSSCAESQQSESSQKPLLVEFTYWWGDYTLLVAQEKGFFEKYGVLVQPVYYPIFSDSFPDLAAGQIDAALIAVGDVMNIERHTNMKVVGISDDGSFMPIVARPEYTSINLLKGKTIGVLVGTQYEVLVSEMLASVNMNLGDVFLTELDPANSIAALASNQVQAVFVWEPFTSQALENGNRIIYPTDRTERLFPDTIAFRESVVKQRPDDIKNFLKAWYEAVDYRLLHPQETSEIAAKYLGVTSAETGADPDLKVMTLADNVALFQNRSAGSIYDTAQRTGNYLLLSGGLVTLPDFAAMLDSTFLPLP